MRVPTNSQMIDFGDMEREVSNLRKSCSKGLNCAAFAFQIIESKY